MTDPRKHEKYDALIDSCRTLSPVRTAVAHPCDEASLAGALEAAAAKIIEPILVGPEARIRARRRNRQARVMKRMHQPILVINAGSSSVKFSVFETESDRSLAAGPHGQVEGIGTCAHLQVIDPNGETLADKAPQAGTIAMRSWPFMTGSSRMSAARPALMALAIAWFMADWPIHNPC